MNVRYILAFLVALLPAGVQSKPFRDAIPATFHGVYGPNLAACADPDQVELMSIGANEMHYYEGDNFLLLGISFDGAATSSGEFIPLFNGRFTGRSETQLLGETNLRLELESSNRLAVYPIGAKGDPVAKGKQVWLRCNNLPTTK